MKFLIFTFLYLGFLNVSMAGVCPNEGDPIYTKIKNYPQSSEFQAGFIKMVEEQTPYKIESVVFNREYHTGESHTGLADYLIPTGLELLGADSYSDLDMTFKYREGDEDNDPEAIDITKAISLLLKVKGPQQVLYAGFRIDNWVLCSGGKIVQALLGVTGGIQVADKTFYIHYTWDLEKKIATGHLGSSPLITCDMDYHKVRIYPTKERGKYITEFDLEDEGSFILTGCELSSQTSLNCQSGGIHSGEVSWMGLVTGKPDKIEFKVFGKNAEGIQESLYSNPNSTWNYKCK